MTSEEAIEQIELAIITGSVDDIQCGALKMAINALENYRWIPMTERLPEKDKNVLLYVKGGTVWMCLPELPKEESKNDDFGHQDIKCNLKCFECSDKKYCDYFDSKVEST